MLLSRRALLAITSTTLLGAAGGVAFMRAARREPWATGPRLESGHPVLRMPFPVGTVVLCQQGNLAPEGRTHSTANCMHALDLSSLSVPAVDVVAAAAGRVAFVYDGASPGDTAAGLRFGNQVKVEHGGGYFTFYSHLDRVTVREGDIVGGAAKLGTMGSTGAAGNRHLHFSLHKGSARDMGVQETIRMQALVAADLSDLLDLSDLSEGGGGGFRAMSSTELRGGTDDVWHGHLYGSENDPARPPLDGEAGPELRADILAAREKLARALDDRIWLDDIARTWTVSDAASTRERLLAILGRDPGHAVGRYWLATAVHIANRGWPEADEILTDLLANGPAQPTWEGWLPAWIHNRLGFIALEEGRVEPAEAHFRRALRLSTAEPDRRFAVERLGIIRSRSEKTAP